MVVIGVLYLCAIEYLSSSPMIGLKAGDEVVFDATKLTVKIANDDEVEYQGVKYQHL